MARRYNRSEKEKWTAPSAPPPKRPPVRIPERNNDDLIAANKLSIIDVSDRSETEAKVRVEVNGLLPLEMKMEIELPTDNGDVIDVEFEYTKIEKHCFTCFSLLHEEVNCPHKSLNDPPPKARVLGITQRIALHRIEAEKKRHDDRRGYVRPEAHSSARPYEGQLDRTRSERFGSRPHYSYDINRELPTSRPGRPHSQNYRNEASSAQYRVVEKSRTSTGSHSHRSPIATSGRQEGHESRAPKDGIYIGLNSPITPPSRSLRDRLGPQAGRAREGEISGSNGRRSALERVAEPTQERLPPSFESGRLQEPVTTLNEDGPMDQYIATECLAVVPHSRIPATLRLGNSGEKNQSRKGKTVPIASSSKIVTKRKDILLIPPRQSL
ncbi:hypothetical protein F2Q69_00023910 [Brassica cretica]|uniref:Zinc knuckle CX2CX4HX4C domain-containing protein n=1 Tax=Brassica cretica TaxID=69181 RepID=A0A8S9Q8D3_BRACR|nr:hypothetical protein F2Q69_00023910 [Brassica cretica]